jgi:peptidoglycan/LPS O-acetylase OafA/YrhL
MTLSGEANRWNTPNRGCERPGTVPRVTLERASEIGRSGNNFDLLRLLAALAVLYTHSFDLTLTDEPFPNGTGLSASTIGVLVFFSISGFLVARSWDYDPRPVSYAVKRGLRLLPALVVCLVLTAVVLGPLVTSLSTSEYIESPQTHGYVVLNSWMWTYDALPGVFEDNAFPTSVNGSLWTLPVEVKAYLLIGVVGLLGLLRGRRRVLLVAIAAYLALLIVPGVRHALPLGDRVVALMTNLQGGSTTLREAHDGALLAWAQLAAAFAIGMTLYALRRWIPLRWDLAALAFAVWLGTVAIGETTAQHAAVWLIPYLVLVLAYRTHGLVRLPSRFGDYSYGIYIYAFVVQQSLLHWFPISSGWTLFFLAVPITFVLAVLSWHVIEARALSLKTRLARPLDRAVDAAPRAAQREALQPVPITEHP